MIRAQNLSMYYGAVPALRDVNFEVKKGEIVGLLGPNGAGKSTTLKIITTYTYPTEGNVFIENLNVRENPIEIRKKIGYLPEQLPLYMDMEVVEYLRFVVKLEVFMYPIKRTSRMGARKMWITNCISKIKQRVIKRL